MALSRVVITVAALSREFGGPVVKARGLASALRAIGYEVTVIGVGSSPGCIGLPQLLRFHGTPLPASLGPLSRSIREADLVHVLGYRDPVGTAAAMISNRARTPYLVEPSGMHRRRLRSLGLKLAYDRLVGAGVLSEAAVMVATSKLEAAELEEDGIAAARIRIRPNGIETEGLLPLPARGALRAKLAIPADALVVLSLGRITAKKGLLHFIKALAGLSGVWGIVAGPVERDGTLERLLAERAKLGLTERLAVLPEGLWGRDRAQAFADSDAFCLPSATENFGNAALEAAAVGLPVVISDACGAAEWLEPQATRVVPYADVELLAEALRDVLHNADIQRASEEAAPRIRESLSWSVVACRQREIYEDIVAGR